ncbi:MAG: AbrB/MazE/SpoVT family DNA-binding domain-containing protein [Bryobacterales bacterium]|nr:AbrB/MazE/SpoVT family DNA-binding domain-containing protein [Bryobacterales bacterium]
MIKSAVKRWGNSAAIRIPASILKALELEIDQPVEVREEGGCIVIKPVSIERYDINALVSQISGKNRHAPVVFRETRKAMRSGNGGPVYS